MSVFVKCLRRCRQNSVSATHDFHSQESVILIFSLDLVCTNKLCEWACMCFKDVRKYVDDCAVCRCVSVCMRMWVRARICLCVCVCVCERTRVSLFINTSQFNIKRLVSKWVLHMYLMTCLDHCSVISLPPVNQPSVCDVTGRYLTRCRNQSVFHCYGQWSRQSSQSPLLDGRGQMSAS